MVRRHEMVLNFRLYVPIGTMVLKLSELNCESGNMKMVKFWNFDEYINFDEFDISGTEKPVTI